MREIKFRCYSFQDRKITPVGSIHFPLLETDLYIINGAIQFPQVKLMQYTNLKDKNGKEIYEGDIIKTRSPFENDQQWQTGVVKFKNDGCCAGFTFRNKGQLECDVAWPGGREVIGNIYENPELIKNEKV